MASNRASLVLGREVRFRGIRLGVVADLLVDLGSCRALGYDVVCGDGARRFLPLAASDLVEDSVEVGSALVLLDDPFYRKRAAAFSTIAGSSVRLGPEQAGVLRDLGFATDGTIVAVDVERRGRLEEVPLESPFAFAVESLRPAV